MVADYHVHTPFCKHAVGAPAEYKQAAAERRLAELCFTDHGPNPDGIGRDVCMDMSQYAEYERMVRNVQTTEPPPVLLGVEADYYPGCEAHWRPWLAARRFDLVLVSVHVLDGWGFDNPAEVDRWKSVDVVGVWKLYFERISQAAASGLFDILAHVDLPKKFGHRLRDKLIKELAQPVLDRVAAADMAIEINSSGLRKPVGELYPSALVLDLMRERGIPICFGSDAHAPAEVGMDFDRSLALAEQAGYRETSRYANRRRRQYPLRHEPVGSGGRRRVEGGGAKT